MATRKRIQQMWRNTKSGMFIPSGFSSDLVQSSSKTYLEIKEKAKAIESLYTENNISLSPTCGLAGLINDAKALSDLWLTGQTALSTALLFRAGHLDRIASAILPLKAVPERAQYLNIFAAGNLDLFKRQKSKAKDTLWELELWAILNRLSFTANLTEPPDIVVNFEDAKIGIACKKFYSERHVQNVLSEAVAQIEATFDFGIVAVNLDDLVPADQVLRMPTQAAMGQFLNELNVRFLQTHERHFRKYLASGRLLSALVSTGVLADVYKERTRFINARQSIVWTIPGLPLEKEKQLKRFYQQFMR